MLGVLAVVSALYTVLSQETQTGIYIARGLQLSFEI